jgi:hypothetical protein
MVKKDRKSEKMEGRQKREKQIIKDKKDNF